MSGPENAATHTREISSDGLTCTFLLSEPISPNRTTYYGDARDAEGDDFLSAVFAVPFVESILTKNAMMIVAQYGGQWDEVMAIVDGLLLEHRNSEAVDIKKEEPEPQLVVTSNDSPQGRVSEESANPDMDESIRSRVQTLLDAEINPGVAAHGGFINLTEVKDGDIYLFMGGGCQGCGMAAATLRQGVEASLRAQIPEIRNIFDSTNHDAGENPYFPT